uniref:Uncharacterized protein n=1 Tax=Molossus molossus TaxID=27622 RepID=A0A7J8ERJ2_MOLMO|nr:hypothetical protein HJG59_008722 [Molossus molossus]
MQAGLQWGLEGEKRRKGLYQCLCVMGRQQRDVFLGSTALFLTLLSAPICRSVGGAAASLVSQKLSDAQNAGFWRSKPGRWHSWLAPLSAWLFPNHSWLFCAPCSATMVTCDASLPYALACHSPESSRQTCSGPGPLSGNTSAPTHHSVSCPGTSRPYLHSLAFWGSFPALLKPGSSLTLVLPSPFLLVRPSVQD